MKVTYINLLGEEHPMCFSLSAIEEISDTFGSVDAMSEAVESDNVALKLSAVSKLLNILIKAGRRYGALVGMELPKEIKGNVGDLIDISDPEAISKVFEAIANDSEREIEVKSKNVEGVTQ